ncbi:hypothetical protein GALL_63210 [mine drainage metagenome]|uniref:Uncharacterized protein n=1 Tax=mine drainage metagenome TaxID=410659 RepID=A0A1J5TJ68_9ZZZZ
MGKISDGYVCNSKCFSKRIIFLKAELTILRKNLTLTLFTIIVISLITVQAAAQSGSSLQKIQNTNIDTKLVTKLDDKYKSLQKNINAKTTDALKSFQKKEAKLKKKLQSVDSTKAKELFGQSEQFYKGLQNKLTTTNNKLTKLGHYFPGLDSLQTATKFLQQAGNRLNNFSPDKQNQLNQLSSSLNSVQGSMQSATEISQLLNQRQQQLQSALQQFGLSKDLLGMNKQVYYYQQQLNDYKATLNDEQKLEQKALSIVRELPAFKDFMAKNSILAQLFPMPQNLGTAQALAGLQTRSSVTQQLQQQLGSATNPQAYMQQQMQAAQTQLNQLKDKINQLGGGSSDIVMPDFKPNTQKTKSFLKRIEYGFNIQSQKTNSLLPTTSDIAITLGYKLSDKATVGTGASYKLGWGNGLNHISMSNQGIGLRSYMDIKLKGSIWITGGYEQNWLPQLATALDSVNVHPSGWGKGWQTSGLIGITKKYKIGKKTSNLQLLWDFLSYRQIPMTPALKFRVGYQF